jgi:hypothetical protein
MTFMLAMLDLVAHLVHEMMSNQDPLGKLGKWHERRFIQGLEDAMANWIRTLDFRFFVQCV